MCAFTRYASERNRVADRVLLITRKAEFNAEEWSTVVNGPLYAGLRVVAASRGGTLRESLAMGRVYTEARQHHGDSELLDELVASPPAIDRDQLQEGGGNMGTLTQDQLRGAIGILEQKATPAELDAYKRFVMTVAQAAATAHKEGGFLGIGGTTISDAENAALDEISSALGTPPEGATPAGSPPPEGATPTASPPPEGATPADATPADGTPAAGTPPPDPPAADAPPADPTPD
jgi:hypothetical protein